MRRFPGVALLAEGVDRNFGSVSIITSSGRSPSSRRAWIEIPYRNPSLHGKSVALLAEGVDRNFDLFAGTGPAGRVALLAEGVDRNPRLRRLRIGIMVALLAEGVDRNRKTTGTSPKSHVALLAEGVDRNAYTTEIFGGNRVALLAEGVDRNKFHMSLANTVGMSPSSRRAWIEILLHAPARREARSPSSRRAWIEITSTATTARPTRVALLAEGVDRNYIIQLQTAGCVRRPPRGGRG